MGNTYAISALRRKRAHLAGEIEAAERALAQKRATLTSLDAALLRFDTERDPTLIGAIKPTMRGSYFRHSEQLRLCMAALREAKRPLSVRYLTEHTMRAVGLDSGEEPLRTRISDQTGLFSGDWSERGWYSGSRVSR
jgi:hypothetical protein